MLRFIVKILNKIFYIYKIIETPNLILVLRRNIILGKWTTIKVSRFQEDVQTWRKKYGAFYYD